MQHLRNLWTSKGIILYTNEALCDWTGTHILCCTRRPWVWMLQLLGAFTIFDPQACGIEGQSCSRCFRSKALKRFSNLACIDSEVPCNTQTNDTSWQEYSHVQSQNLSPRHWQPWGHMRNATVKYKGKLNVSERQATASGQHFERPVQQQLYPSPGFGSASNPVTSSKTWSKTWSNN